MERRSIFGLLAGATALAGFTGKVLAKEPADGLVKQIKETKYLITNADHERMLNFIAGCEVTVSAGLQESFVCGWRQGGAEQVIFLPGKNLSLVEVDGGRCSARQHAVGGLMKIDENTIQLHGQTV